MPDVRGGLLARQANLAQYGGAELRSYEPTWRERLLAGLLGDKKPTPERRRVAEGLIGTSSSPGIADLTPAGIPMAIQEAARRGDTQGVAMAVMPMPGARMARGMRPRIPMRSAAKEVERLSATAKKSKVVLDVDTADPQDWILSWLGNESGVKGAGASYLRQLNDLADKHGARIQLGADDKFLVNYYKKHGYRRGGEMVDGGEAMYRLPRSAADLSKRDAENAIISATRSNSPPGDLASGAAPDRSGYTLIRHRAPKGDSARFKTLETKIDQQPAVKREVMQLARDGEDIGRKWYNTEALRDRFIGALGTKDGDAAWREYIWLVGATSTGSKVPSNIRNASHYFVQNSQNKLGAMAQDLMAGNYTPAKGYGHKMQKNQMLNVARAATGAWSPETAAATLNPKPRGFLQSLLGNQTNIAADRHFMRLMGMMSDDQQFLHTSAEISQPLRAALREKYGKKIEPYLSEVKLDNGAMRINFNAKKAAREGPKDLYNTIKRDASVWDDMPNDNEYAAFERIASKMAKELNMTGPQFQASLWMGAAKKTGVDPSSLDTFVNLFDKRVKDAAAERGRTPEDVFKRFATRKEALAVPLGLLGASRAGGLLSNQQD